MKATLNLLPVEEKARGPERKFNIYYLLLGVPVYIVVILSLWLLNVQKIKKINVEINNIQRQRTELQKQIKPAAATTVATSFNKEILNAVERAPRWSLLISNMSVIVPEEVWLSSIASTGSDKMSIKGFSTTQLGVANFISALEASRYFHDVEIVFVQKGANDISFELKTGVRWI